MGTPQFFTAGVQQAVSLSGTERIPLDLAAGGSEWGSLDQFKAFIGSSDLRTDVGIYLAAGGTLFQLQYYPLAMSSQQASFPSSVESSAASCLVAANTSTAKLWITASLSDFAANGGSGAQTICEISFANGSLMGVFTTKNTLIIPEQTVLFLVIDQNWNDGSITGIQILLRGDIS